MKKATHPRQAKVRVTDHAAHLTAQLKAQFAESNGLQEKLVRESDGMRYGS